MINVTRRDPDVVGRTVNENKLEWLGPGPDRNDYAVYKGQEYLVEPHPCNPEDYSRRRDELYVMRVRRELIDGSAFEHHNTYRALPVPNGTRAASVAKEAERQARLHRQPPSRPLSAASLHPLLRSRQPTILQGRSPSNPLLRGQGMLFEGRGPIYGVAAVRGVLRDKGQTQALTHAGIPYWEGGPPTVDVLTLIKEYGPLLDADFLGQPLHCDFRHDGNAPIADIPLHGSAAVVCWPHFAGELAP